MPSALRSAPGTGHIDTAAAYGNERQVGEAVHSSEVDRSEIFLETKIWISDYGYEETLHGFEKSARKLGVDQIDLLILHQALPSAFERTLEAYRALETLLADGNVRAIGVSNFMIEHLTTLLDRASVVPAFNQIESTPISRSQRSRTSAPSTASSRKPGHQSAVSPSTATATTAAPSTTQLSEESPHAHAKTPAQVMLRWGLQHGRSVIPKSTKPSRIAENINVFDFERPPTRWPRSTAWTPVVAAAPPPTRSPSSNSAERSRKPRSDLRSTDSDLAAAHGAPIPTIRRLSAATENAKRSTTTTHHCPPSPTGQSRSTAPLRADR